MSFQRCLTVFQIWAVLIFGLTGDVRAVYEHNPFLQRGKNDNILPKDLNQFNLAVIVPPGNEPYLTRPGDKPPSPPAPGYVWVQIPLSNNPVNGNKPTDKIPSAVTDGPITQQPPDFVPTIAPPLKTTKEPVFTIEPPDVLYGHDLNRKCLKPTGQFPSNSCNRYVNCWEGVAIEQICPVGLLFSPVKLYCDYAGNVDCQGKPITKNTTPAPTVGPGYITSANPTQEVASSSATPVISVAKQSLRKLCWRSTGLFPGSTCSKFVNCWDDNVVEQDCPDGLYFSSEGYCDYPENVDCAGHSDEKDIAEKTNPKNSECPLEFGNFRDRKNCSQYYSCAYYKVAAKYECPEGFSFSDLLGLCDYSYRVDCSKEPQIFQKNAVNYVQGNNLPTMNAYLPPKPAESSGMVNNIPTTMNAYLPPAHTQTQLLVKNVECPLEFGTFRDSINCSQYYTCAYNKVAATFGCPEGFSFSDLLGLCDYSYRVDCSKEPQIYQKNTLNGAQGNDLSFNAYAHPELSKPADVGDTRCIVSVGLVRDRDNCSLYYVCELGKVAASYVCPPGYKFSNKLGVCDHEEKVNCDNPNRAYDLNTETMAIPDIPKEILSQVQNCVPGSVFRLNPQCTSACHCRNGVAEIIQCIDGLAYDSKLDKCVSAHLARC